VILWPNFGQQPAAGDEKKNLAHPFNP